MKISGRFLGADIQVVFVCCMYVFCCFPFCFVIFLSVFSWVCLQCCSKSNPHSWVKIGRSNIQTFLGKMFELMINVVFILKVFLNCSALPKKQGKTRGFMSCRYVSYGVLVSVCFLSSPLFFAILSFCILVLWIKVFVFSCWWLFFVVVKRSKKDSRKWCWDKSKTKTRTTAARPFFGRIKNTNETQNWDVRASTFSQLCARPEIT